MALLCFGGSFNPIHHGHLICARAAMEAGGFDGVVLIPCGQPPHKPNAANLAAPEHRLAMCHLAIQSLCGWTVDDLEMVRGGPSYSIDTVRELRRRGWPAVHWLIGADMLPGLPSWHEAKKLIGEVNFVVMARGGAARTDLPTEYQRLWESAIATPLIDISATDIRRRVAAGKPIDFLTPPAVCDYIHHHRLYLPAP